jgi:hypothetical protein
MGQVVTYSQGGYDARTHECATRAGVARELAGLLDYEFGGEYDATARYEGPLYFVPSDTLVGCAQAAALGIRGTADLFGAVVAHPYVSTKSITHGLVDDDAATPSGWTPHFARAVDGCVLRGYSAFCHVDAHRAGRALLEHSPVRVKRATGIGGGGQFVAESTDALRDVLDALEAAELAAWGVVLEENLSEVETFSVGRVEVGGLVATYCGTQRLTPNNHGAEVYGGSELIVARGEYEALAQLDLAPDMRAAIDAALRYDRAADRHFEGFIASRRNYDVVRGLDTRGAARLGVLEQSWRIGGPSPAEAGALTAFKSDPGLGVVLARTVELYGDDVDVPSQAKVFYRDVDPRVGRLTKYAMIDRSPHAYAR